MKPPPAKRLHAANDRHRPYAGMRDQVPQTVSTVEPLNRYTSTGKAIAVTIVAVIDSARACRSQVRWRSMTNRINSTPSSIRCGSP
jgi:hypothetical protein